jgi:hypothetical protein
MVHQYIQNLPLLVAIFLSISYEKNKKRLETETEAYKNMWFYFLYNFDAKLGYLNWREILGYWDWGRLRLVAILCLS